MTPADRHAHMQRALGDFSANQSRMRWDTRWTESDRALERWVGLPGAAGRAATGAHGVLERHRPMLSGDCSGCPGEPNTYGWPCPEVTNIIAVLKELGWYV